MGQQLSVLSASVTKELLAALDASPGYRSRLQQIVLQYQSDRSLSPAQILQWSAEKLVADATNAQHELGARFLPALAACDLRGFDATTVTQCIAQAAMQYLEELKLDINFHLRFFDCAHRGSVEAMKKIEPFVEINYQNESGSSALMIAAHHNHVNMVEHLLALHASINLQDHLGWSALMFACREGHAELVDLLLQEEYDTELELTTQTGINALMCAADAGHTRIVRTLMEKGADVNACTNVRICKTRTLRNCELERKSERSLMTLLCLVFLMRQTGDTALLQACHSGHVAIVRLLLSAGADVNVSGKHLCSPSLLAARFGSYEILELLVAAGADIAAQDEQGRTVCNFEQDGQVAAALQRGVVGRFNRSIRPGGGSMKQQMLMGRSGMGHASTSNSIQDSPSGGSQYSASSPAASSAASAASPSGHPRYTPHPNAALKPSRGSAPHGATAPSPLGESRSPSPGLPPVRTRKAGGAAAPPVTVGRNSAAAAASSSAAARAHGAVAGSAASVTSSVAPSPIAATALASSRAFQHPMMSGGAAAASGTELSDEALEAMEANMEQILSRRDPASARNAASSASSNQSSRKSTLADATAPPPARVQRHVPSAVSAAPTAGAASASSAPRNILKSSRVDSPTYPPRGSRSAAATAATVAPLPPSMSRLDSDNVHQEEEPESEHDEHEESEEGEEDDIDEAGSEQQRRRPPVHSDAIGELISGEDDESERLSASPPPSAPPPRSLPSLQPASVSPYKRALEAHLAQRMSDEGVVEGREEAIAPPSRNQGPRASKSKASRHAKPTKSAEPVAAAPTASGAREEAVLADGLARLPMDAAQIAQVAAHLSATAATVGLVVAPPARGADSPVVEAAASPLATTPHAATDSRGRNEAASMDAPATTASPAPPAHRAALREVVAAAFLQKQVEAAAAAESQPVSRPTALLLPPSRPKPTDVIHSADLADSELEEESVSSQHAASASPQMRAAVPTAVDPKSELLTASVSPDAIVLSEPTVVLEPMPQTNALPSALPEQPTTPAKPASEPHDADSASAAALSHAPASAAVAATVAAPSAAASSRSKSKGSKASSNGGGGGRKQKLVEIAAPLPPKPVHLIQSPFHPQLNQQQPKVSPSGSPMHAAAAVPAALQTLLGPFQLAKTSPTLRPSKPNEQMQRSMPLIPTAAPVFAGAAAAPHTNGSSGYPQSRGSSSKSSASSSPLLAATAPPPSSGSRRDTSQAAADSWLTAHGFDRVARSSLAGFTMSDLRSLEHADCVELLGDRVGPVLFIKLRHHPQEAQKQTPQQPHQPQEPQLIPESPVAADAHEDPTPEDPAPHPASWLEAAVHGMQAAAQKDAEEAQRQSLHDAAENEQDEGLPREQETHDAEAAEAADKALPSTATDRAPEPHPSPTRPPPAAVHDDDGSEPDHSSEDDDDYSPLAPHQPAAKDHLAGYSDRSGSEDESPAARRGVLTGRLQAVESAPTPTRGPSAATPSSAAAPVPAPLASPSSALSSPLSSLSEVRARASNFTRGLSESLRSSFIFQGADAVDRSPPVAQSPSTAETAAALAAASGSPASASTPSASAQPAASGSKPIKTSVASLSAVQAAIDGEVDAPRAAAAAVSRPSNGRRPRQASAEPASVVAAAPPVAVPVVSVISPAAASSSTPPAASASASASGSRWFSSLEKSMSSSVQSLKYKLAGTTRNEEIRKTQPHVIRRAAAAAAAASAAEEESLEAVEAKARSRHRREESEEQDHKLGMRTATREAHAGPRVAYERSWDKDGSAEPSPARAARHAPPPDDYFTSF